MSEIDDGVSPLSVEETKHETSDEESDDESSDDEEMPPPPPRKSAMQNVVTHIRHYSEEYKRHYYTCVDDIRGESDWVPPTVGIVQCVDEETGKTFYTHSSTGKTAWSLSELT